MSGYIPRRDADFHIWQQNFLTYAAAHQADLGLTAGDLAPLTGGQTDWAAALTAHTAAQNAAHGARAAKDRTRKPFEAAIRGLVGRIQANAAVSDADRAALGVTVPDRTPTPVAPPATWPSAWVESGQRLRQVLHFRDAQTPTRRAKPKGVRGAEVWVKIGGPPPAGPSELSYLGLATRTPHLVEFAEADGGKAAHYMLRWQNSRGEPGPWSETATATIGQ